MANALPILLLGGAALLMMGGKKKSGAVGGGQIILPPTTPPPLSPAVKKSGSGYPGVSRDQMQEIQTMLMANGYGVGAKGLDGRYGPATKQAVWEFQEDWGQGLVVDGKPGSKTRAALKQAEAGRLDAQQQQAQQQPQKKAQLVDQCDPLDPGTWGAGNVCVLDGSRWVRAKAQVAAPKAPAKPVSKINCGPDRLWKWDVKAGGICLTEGKDTYLEDWLPGNMSVVMPTGIRPAGRILYGQGWGTWESATKEGFSKYIEIQAIEVSGASYDFHDKSGNWYKMWPAKNFAQWLSAVKSIAGSYPEIYFSIEYGKPGIESK